MDKQDSIESRELQGVESELRHCLQHVPAPAGFTDAVMARVAHRESMRGTPARRTVSFAGIHRHAGWWTAAAAMLVLAVGGGDALHAKHQRQAAETTRVQQQMDLAMELTNHALNEVNEGLDRSPAGRYAHILDGSQK